MRPIGLTALTVLAGLTMATPAAATPECQPFSDTPLASVNGSGQMLVVWRGACSSSHVEFSAAAIGSATTGFSDVGTILPPEAVAPEGLSSPTSVFLDNAGEAWIAGVHQATQY